MGGLNLELFKFGMYVFFPIAFMGYFGTNLDDRFHVPDFWPKAEESNKVPKERDEIQAELERLRARRLYFRDKRLAEEARRQAEKAAPATQPLQTQDHDPLVPPPKQRTWPWW